VAILDSTLFYFMMDVTVSQQYTNISYYCKQSAIFMEYLEKHSVIIMPHRSMNSTFQNKLNIVIRRKINCKFLDG